MAELKLKAQERYAQEAMDYLFTHVEELSESGQIVIDAEGIVYHGSMHQFIRRMNSSAQVGDVVNILREMGAIRSVGHGQWELVRQNVFEDAEGNPIQSDVVSYHGERPVKVLEKQIRELAGRIGDLETALERVMEVLQRRGEDEVEPGTEIEQQETYVNLGDDNPLEDTYVPVEDS